MTNENPKKTIAVVISAACIIAVLTACSSSMNSNEPSSDTVTTTVTDIQTPAPETTTATETTTTTAVTDAVTTMDKQTETSATTPAPETEQTTTTTITETQAPAPETTTVAPIPETTTKAPAPEETVEKLNKKMYAIGAVCSYEKNTIRFSDPVDKYHMNDEVTVVEKVAGMYNGKGCDEGYFYKLDDGTYVPAGLFTENKNWQAETTFQTYDWNPDNPEIPDLPPSDKFVGDLFD